MSPTAQEKYKICSPDLSLTLLQESNIGFEVENRSVQEIKNATPAGEASTTLQQPVNWTPRKS
jgi:hypothetical protein